MASLRSLVGSGLLLSMSTAVGLSSVKVNPADAATDVQLVAIHSSMPPLRGVDDVAQNSSDGLWYAITSDSSVTPAVAPALVAIDPANGRVVRRAELGSKAEQIEMSADGATGYVLGADDVITEFATATLATIRQFSFGIDGTAQVRDIDAMAAIPGGGGRLAVVSSVLSSQGELFEYQEITVFESGRRLPDGLKANVHRIVGGETPGRFYAVSSGITPPGEVLTVGVSATGAFVVDRFTVDPTPPAPQRLNRDDNVGGQPTSMFTETSAYRAGPEYEFRYRAGRLYGRGIVIDIAAKSARLLWDWPLYPMPDGRILSPRCVYGALPPPECEVAVLTGDGVVEARFKPLPCDGESPEILPWGVTGFAVFSQGSLCTFDPTGLIGARGEYHPIVPSRLLDTRLGVGRAGLVRPVGPTERIEVAVAAVAGLPSVEDVEAVVLTVTATNPTAEGYLSVWPSGTPQTTVSSVNFLAGETVPNLVTVGVGADGRVSIFNGVGSTDVIVDVSGYFSTFGGEAGSRFHPVAPERIIDTRNAIGLPRSPLTDRPVEAVVTSDWGVPSSGVTAVVVNVTVTNPTQDGYLTVYPAGVDRPTVSNLNFRRGQTVANMVIVKSGVGGRISLANFTGTTDVIVDLVGYFDGVRNGASGRYLPLEPHRVSDTRNYGFGSRLRSEQAQYVAALPATSVTLMNVTATDALAAGYLASTALTGAVPATSSVNFVPGRSSSNQVIVFADGLTGRTKFSSIWVSGGPVHVIVDVYGAFI